MAKTSLSEIALENHALTKPGRRKIKLRASSDARLQVAVGEQGPSATEVEIRQLHESDAEKTRRAAQENTDRLLNAVRTGESVPSQAQVDEIVTGFAARLDSEIGESNWRLADLVHTLVAAFAYLTQFKIDNDIKREAQCPASKISHFGTIFLVMILDAVLNSFFYGVASGLIHGLVMALVVSVILVGMGAITGAFAVRRLYANDSFNRVMGGIGTAVFAVCSFFMSLAAASYRDALTQDYEAAPAAMVWSIMRVPTELTFDACCLLLFSLGACWLSCWKGLHLDDVIPAYGTAHRLYIEAKEKLQQAWSSAMSMVTDRVSSAHQHLEALVEEAATIVKIHRIALSSAIATVREFDAHMSEIEGAYALSVSVYHETFGAVAQQTVAAPTTVLPPKSLNTDGLEELEELVATSEKELTALRLAASDAKTSISNKGTEARAALQEHRSTLEKHRVFGVSLDAPVLKTRED